MGDFNAKIGNELWHRGTTGGHSLHDDSNDNGERLINFASSRNLVISSTCFPHRNIHKQTWRSPDSRTVNQIDHVLTCKRWASSVMDVRSFRGANCDSDHHLVRTLYRCRISSLRQSKSSPPRIFEVEKLLTESTAEEYARALQQKLAPVLVNSGSKAASEQWCDLRNTIKDVAETVIGFKPRRIRNDWFDQECKTSLDVKNEAYRQYIARPTRAKREKYDELRRLSNKTIRRKKRKHYDEQLLNIDKDLASKNTRRAYRQLNSIKNGHQPRTSLCKDKNGNIISDTENIKKRWASYFEELLNPTTDMPTREALLIDDTVNPTADSRRGRSRYKIPKKQQGTGHRRDPCRTTKIWRSWRIVDVTSASDTYLG